MMAVTNGIGEGADKQPIFPFSFSTQDLFTMSVSLASKINYI